MNVLAMPDGAGVTYSISREGLRSVESVVQIAERQLAELGSQMKGYQVVLAPTPLAAIPGASEALEFAGAFSQNGQGIHQRQAALQIADTRRVLIATMSGFEPFDAQAIQAWSLVIRSIQLREKI